MSFWSVYSIKSLARPLKLFLGTYLREDGICVNKKDCGCQIHGKVMENGSTIQSNCKNCLCQDHHWICSSTADCASSCSAFGAGHVTTLDGFEYTHRTHGRFIMARDEHNQFELEVEFGPCELNEKSTCFHRAELTLSHLLRRGFSMRPVTRHCISCHSIHIPCVQWKPPNKSESASNGSRKLNFNWLSIYTITICFKRFQNFWSKSNHYSGTGITLVTQGHTGHTRSKWGHWSLKSRS